MHTVHPVLGLKHCLELVTGIVESVNSVKNVLYTDHTLYNVLNQVQGIQYIL